MSSRKKLNNSSMLSGTPTQQVSLSPSRLQIMKSPASTCKYLAQSNNRPNVSYGELQIVLQNIQQIRAKANNQVKALTIQNTQLKEQLATSQETVKSLNEKNQNYQRNRSDSEKKIIWQLQTLQNNKIVLEAQITQKQKRIIALEVSNKELQKQIQMKTNKIETNKKEIEEFHKKWKWAFSILAGSEQRAEEMIWKVKNEFAEGLWTLLQTYAQKDQTTEMKNQQVLFLQKQVEKNNEKLRQVSVSLDRCNDQLKNSKAKLQQAKSEYKKLGVTCSQLKLEKKELESIVQKLKGQMEELRRQHSVQIKQKNRQIQKLEEELHDKQMKQAEIKKKIEYQNLIGELCDDSQEFNQLLQRVRYLQKFRTQYFFNVQKIQFLCKQLDN